MAVEKLKNYIAGEWRESETKEGLDVYNPAADQVIAQVPLSTAAEVDRAVSAADEAFAEWRETPPTTRVQYLFRLNSLGEIIKHDRHHDPGAFDTCPSMAYMGIHGYSLAPFHCAYPSIMKIQRACFPSVFTETPPSPTTWDR